MHLWPSMKIRDSFKTAYLKNLEWNLHRMNSQKPSEAASQKLIATPTSPCPESKHSGIVVTLLWDLVVILSCCFCCGVFEDEED